VRSIGRREHTLILKLREDAKRDAQAIPSLNKLEFPSTLTKRQKN